MTMTVCHAKRNRKASAKTAYEIRQRTPAPDHPRSVRVAIVASIREAVEYIDRRNAPGVHRVFRIRDGERQRVLTLAV